MNRPRHPRLSEQDELPRAGTRVCATLAIARRRAAKRVLASWGVAALAQVSWPLCIAAAPQEHIREKGNYALLAAADGGLKGTEWVVQSLDGVSPIPGITLTLRVEPDGRVSGSSGCNRFAGLAEESKETLWFGKLASTRRVCPPPLMEQEVRFLESLEQARSYHFSRGSLLLRDGAGAELVRLIRFSQP